MGHSGRRLSQSHHFVRIGIAFLQTSYLCQIYQEENDSHAPPALVIDERGRASKPQPAAIDFLGFELQPGIDFIMKERIVKNRHQLMFTAEYVAIMLSAAVFFEILEGILGRRIEE